MHGTFTAPNLDASAFLAKHGIFINPSLSKIKELQNRPSPLSPAHKSAKKPRGARIIACPPNYKLGKMILNVGDIFPFDAKALHK